MQGAPYRHGSVKRPHMCYIPHTEEVVSFTGMFWHPSRWLQNFPQSRNLLSIQINAFSLCQKTVLRFPFGKGQYMETILLCMIFWSGPGPPLTYPFDRVLPLARHFFRVNWNSFSDMTLPVVFRFDLTITISWFFWNISTKFSILLEYSIWAHPPLLFCPQSWEGFSS